MGNPLQLLFIFGLIVFVANPALSLDLEGAPPSVNVEDRRYENQTCKNLQFRKRLLAAAKQISAWKKKIHQAIGATGAGAKKNSASCTQTTLRNSEIDKVKKPFYKAASQIMRQLDMVRFCKESAKNYGLVRSAKHQANQYRKKINMMVRSLDSLEGSSQQLQSEICQPDPFLS